MRQKRKLYDMIDLYFKQREYYTDHPTEHWPEISYTDEDEQTVTVIDGDMFWHFVTEHYPTFKFFDAGAYVTIKMEADYTLNEAFLNFLSCWSDFINIHPEYARLAQMLDRSDYDPLENYDRKEDGGWKDTTDDDAIHKMEYAKQETTTTNDPKIKTKTTGSVYADNSTTAVPDTESITEPVRANASDVDTVKTENAAHTDKSSVEGDLTVTRLFQDYHVHGNIGVTTAAQMIEGEAKVREKYNIIIRCLEAFAKSHLTLVEEVRL